MSGENGEEGSASPRLFYLVVRDSSSQNAPKDGIKKPTQVL